MKRINKESLSIEKRYRSLPKCFYSEVEEGSFPSPRLVLYNEELEESTGLSEELASLTEEEKARVLSGNKKFSSLDEPLAMAYCGHQFGYFTMLGDGRAKLIKEWLSPGGELMDLHLKGSGRTGYSRNGDGKSAFSPALREYLVSEAMYSLGIPTTRSLSVVLTGENVYRDGYKHGAVLSRIAKSHIRVGTFEYARVTSKEALLALADYTIERLYPELLSFQKEGSENRYLKLLEAVMKKQAALIAAWQSVGFIHGVMNTDNMSISGETIDYGPCAFMDEYQPGTVFSSIDTMGRYRYENQPEMAKWNLTRLGEALLPVIDEKEDRGLSLVKEVLARFDRLYEEAFLSRMEKKLAIVGSEYEKKKSIIQALLPLMYENKADFTNTFVRLTLAMGGENASYLDGTERLFSNPSFFEWTKEWKKAFIATGKSEEELFSIMKENNPFIIPRNHLVEQALSTFLAGHIDYYQNLYEALKIPYSYHENHRKYQELNPVPNPNYRTFCGT